MLNQAIQPRPNLVGRWAALGDKESDGAAHVGGSLDEKGTVPLAGRTQNTDESSFGIVISEVDFALGLHGEPPV